MTVIARLHREVMKPAPRLLDVRVSLSLADAVALDAEIARLCPDHIECDCGTVICPTHQIHPEAMDCVAGRGTHCGSCSQECRDCYLQMRRDARGDEKPYDDGLGS